MSLSTLHANSNPSLARQLGLVKAEVEYLQKQGMPQAQIQQHIQNSYTGTDIPGDALYAMLLELQKSVPQTNPDPIAVQAAKMTLQNAQAQQQPGLNIQQLQSMLGQNTQQQMQPGQQQAPGKTAPPQMGQGIAPMRPQPQAQPVGAGAPPKTMRKGGLADLPKPNVGDQKNFAAGGIVAFGNPKLNPDEDQLVEEDTPYSSSIAGRFGSLFSIPDWMQDPEAGLYERATEVGARNTLADIAGGPSYRGGMSHHPKSPSKQFVGREDQQFHSPWDMGAAPRVTPEVLKQAGAASTSSAAHEAPTVTAKPPPGPNVRATGGAGSNPFAGAPSEVTAAYKMLAAQKAPSSEDYLALYNKLEGQTGAAASYKEARDKLSGLSNIAEQLRAREEGNAADIGRAEAAELQGRGIYGTGIASGILGYLQAGANIKKHQAEAQKDYLSSMLGITKEDVTAITGEQARKSANLRTAMGLTKEQEKDALAAQEKLISAYMQGRDVDVRSQVARDEAAARRDYYENLTAQRQHDQQMALLERYSTNPTFVENLKKRDRLKAKIDNNTATPADIASYNQLLPYFSHYDYLADPYANKATAVPRTPNT